MQYNTDPHDTPLHCSSTLHSEAASDAIQQDPIESRRLEIDELDKAIGQLNRSINQSTYQWLILIREFDERAGWLRWSFTNAVSWLAWRCDIGVGAAREKLRIAHALKTLPRIADTFEAGKLSYSKVRVMTRIATLDNEEDLIAIASNMTVRNLTEYCKQRSNARRDSINTAKAAQNSRAFRVWPDVAKGTLHFSIELPAEDGALFEKAVEKAAMQNALESGGVGAAQSPFGDEPSWAALQADALVSIMRSFLSADGANQQPYSESSSKPASNPESNPGSGPCSHSGSTADHYQVVVHVDENALNGITQTQTTEKETEANGTTNPDNNTAQYPIETVRRLCCDGSVVPIIENSDGEPLSVGRKVRTISTAIRRALWARDQGCAFPGCNHTRFVDAHHLKHWALGGKTDIDNLILLCSKHHTWVHEGGYTIHTDSSGKRFFRRPDGRAVPENGFYAEDWQDTDVGGEPDNTEPKNSRAFGVGVVHESSAGVKEVSGGYFADWLH